MTLATYSFLVFLGSLGLFFWRGGGSGGAVLRMIVWSVLGFLAAVGMLAGLFTLWWPPAHGWAVFWSGAAVGVLAIIMVSNSRPSDWIG